MRRTVIHYSIFAKHCNSVSQYIVSLIDFYSQKCYNMAMEKRIYRR